MLKNKNLTVRLTLADNPPTRQPSVQTSFVIFYGSATNSSSGLIVVKIRAESGRIFNKNPGKIRAKNLGEANIL